MPAGVAEHRAVLGTPAHRPRFLLQDVAADVEEDEVVPDPVPPPEIPARPVERTDPVPPSATALVKLAEDHRWIVETYYMRGTRMDARWKAGRVVSSVVVRLHRDGHRLIACWQTRAELDPAVWWAAKDWPGTPFMPSFSPWGFESGWSLTHEASSIGSPELRKMIIHPRMWCDSCGEPPALHILTPGGLVCHSVLTPPKEVP